MTDEAGRAGAKLEQTHEGEFHGDMGDSGHAIAITKSTKLFCFCAALNSCNLGYDIGVSSEAGILVKDAMGLSDTQIEVFMGSLGLFAMVGALLSHVIADRWGRRGAFIVSTSKVKGASMEA
jgi:MFS family permease